MPAHAINGTITATVTPFGGTYLSPLTVGKVGRVAPTAAGATGIYGPTGHAGTTITNNGHAGGGNGGPSGGIGVDLLSRSVLNNNGTITGGAGGYFAHAAAAGGVGVDFAAGGTLTNAGLVAGGKAGGHYTADGAGGIGVDSGARAQVINGGTILGGAAYSGYGTGGIGVDLTVGGTLTNTGTIAGGYGGGGTLSPNTGVGSGVYFGGVGVLNNSGDIAGGAGIYTFGSLGTTADGDGVVFKGASTLNNSGTITGGASHNGLNSGGAAVDLRAGDTLTNSGTIMGAAGHQLGTGQGLLGGGDGVHQSGGVLTNTGVIAGGVSNGNYAATGVYINGGTLINAGTISGGEWPYGFGDAVTFGSLGGTLVIDPGAVFNGDIAADPHATTNVQLAGTSPGTLTVNDPFFGYFKDFTWVAVEKGSDWTMPGMFFVTKLFTDVGTLDIAEAVRIGGTLLVGGAGTAHIGSIELTRGTITDQALGTTTVGPTSTGGVVGETVINPGGTISGYGVVTGGTVIDNGSIVATGSRLELELSSTVTGSGVAIVESSGTLQVDKSLAVASVQFGPTGNNILLIENGASMTTPISGFGSYQDAVDTIAVLGIQANGLTLLSGTLNLQENGATVDQFNFKGSYTAANFRVTPDTQGGTDIHYVASTVATAPDMASAPTNADLAGGAGNFDPWTDNLPAIALNSGGEGDHAF